MRIFRKQDRQIEPEPEPVPVIAEPRAKVWNYSERDYMVQLPGLPPMEVNLRESPTRLIIWDDTTQGSSVVGEVKLVGPDEDANG